MAKLLFGLCKGRHSIQFLTDDQYIFCDPLDAGNIQDIQAKADAWVDKNMSDENNHLDLVVTGLTSASIAVINAVKSKGYNLTCWHFNQARPKQADGVTPTDDPNKVVTLEDYIPQLVR